MTGAAIIISHYNYYAAIGIVFTGQIITMISRLIGRIEAVRPIRSEG